MKNHILEEIFGNVKHFFNESETSDLQTLLKSEKDRNSLAGGSERSFSKYPEYHSESIALRFEVDRLVTIAQAGLPKKTFEKLSLALAETLIYKGEFDLADEVIENAVNMNGTKDPEISANFDLLKSKIDWSNSDWNSAKRFCQSADRKYSAINDIKGMSECINVMGIIAGEMGDLTSAENHYSKGLTLIQDTDIDDHKAMYNVNLGIISDMKGNQESAEEHYKEALELYKKHDNQFQQARLNHNLGMLHLKKENYNKALEYFDKSISMSLANNHHSNYSLSLTGKATCYLHLSDFESANNFADNAFEIAFGINDRLTIAEVYRVKGLIQQKIENFQLAEEYLHMSLRINENLSNQYNSAETSLDLSEVYYSLNKKEQADMLKAKAKRYRDNQNIN